MQSLSNYTYLYSPPSLRQALISICIPGCLLGVQVWATTSASQYYYFLITIIARDSSSFNTSSRPTNLGYTISSRPAYGSN